MNHYDQSVDWETLILRIVWMLVFFLAWQVAEVVLLGIVVVQLVLRLARGAASPELMALGDSVSQYMAQTGRFWTFNTEQKPWPLSDWPQPRPADVEPASRKPV